MMNLKITYRHLCVFCFLHRRMIMTIQSPVEHESCTEQIEGRVCLSIENYRAVFLSPIKFAVAVYISAATT